MNIDYNSIREELNVPMVVLSIEDIDKAYSESLQHKADSDRYTFECILYYNLSRKIGDKEVMEYYKNKLLGKLGMVG